MAHHADPDRGTELLRLDPVDGHGDKDLASIPHRTPPSIRDLQRGGPNPQLDVLREAFPDGQVTFRSTVHNTLTLVTALREFTLETSIYFRHAPYPSRPPNGVEYGFRPEFLGPEE